MATAALVAPTLPAKAAAAAACSAPPLSPVIKELSWAQKSLQPERTRTLAQGDTVTVAVVDTGVDATHSQLKTATVAGYDFVTDTAGGGTDCDSHGTAIASIISATKEPGVGFVGLAPKAKVMPIRVADALPSTSDGRPTVDGALFAKGIRWATEHGARVISSSVVFFDDIPAIADAVEDAIAHGVIVVAAVGNHHHDGTAPDAVPYPAAYPGVVGVGAIGPTGVRAPSSYVGPYVDIVAPGERVTAAARGAGHQVVNGTSFAAPFVAATVALIMSGPERPQGAAAITRLLATADPSGAPQEYGRGAVNPYRALTERATSAAPEDLGALADPVEDEAVRQRAARWDAAGSLAAGIAVGAVALSTLVLVTAGTWIRGRARRWRPRRRETAQAPVEESTVDESTVRFYTVPRP